jgi:POT family proton-dependent oligopeptide transporter
MSGNPTDPTPALSRPRQRTFLGHPLGLYVLFFSETWERFNYYGRRALLVLDTVNYFRWPQPKASFYYKIFPCLCLPFWGFYPVPLHETGPGEGNECA